MLITTMRTRLGCQVTTKNLVSAGDKDYDQEIILSCPNDDTLNLEVPEPQEPDKGRTWFR